MIGLPGSGKSTLAAGLVYRGGWRLLSDELALLSLGDGAVSALPKPISLKNESIAIMKRFAPGASFSRESWIELQKVTWPDYAQLRNATWVVIVFVIAISLIIFGMDAAVRFVVNTIMGIFGA